MKRTMSQGRIVAHGGCDEGLASPKRSMPRVQSAPAQLQSLEAMARAQPGDLVDAAYFAPPTPSGQIGGDTSLGAVGPNALSLHVPHVAGSPAAGADLDRGGVTLTEQPPASPSDASFTETRNLGGWGVGSTFDSPLHGSDHHTKMGVNAATHGQNLSLASSVAFHDIAKDELGMGVSFFGSANTGLRVVSDSDGDGVTVESRHASGKGIALDPRVAWAPVWAGVFFKMVQSQTDETLFRLTVTQKRAGKLLERQRHEGLTGPLKDWLRQWGQVARGRPSLRQPDISDPFADHGGRKMLPGQTLMHHRNQTRVVGAGAGLLGLRVGRYNLYGEETQVVIRCLDDRHVALAISPRTAHATSKNVDSPLGPNLQGMDTQVKGFLRECVFNLRDPQQKALYLRLVRGDVSPVEVAAAIPSPRVTEEAQLIGRDEAKGVVRVPFATSWGGFGEHLSRHEMNISRDERGRLSQTREVVGQIVQHALEQGRNGWRIAAASHASSVAEPGPACMLAFRGLRVSHERSATRPDLAMRNIMTAEHARLWRKAIPPVTDNPRNDYKIVATTVFSGRQLSALEKTLPARAAATARATGAVPELLIALIGTLRDASRRAPLAAPFACAWQRSIHVANYLQAAGAPGLAALHRLLGGAVEVRTLSSIYTEPLAALAELKYLARPSRTRAQAIAEQLRSALRAARADAVLRTYHTKGWIALTEKLAHAMGEADAIAGA